jgi:cytoskeleton protein RodZ
VSDDGAQTPEFQFQTVGEKLKSSRERKGYSLSDIAQRTRIPLRHLEAIEQSEYTSLPGSTYTIGFAKAYARTTGLNDGEIATELRAELAQGNYGSHQTPSQSYEPADASRVPSFRMAWVAAGLAALLLAGYFVWRSFALSPSAPETPIAAEEAESGTEAGQGKASEPAQAAIDPKGQVTLTATDIVWVRVYDADKKRLFEKEMQAGEKYDVPADAKNPMINTGRPQTLTVTVGGKPVPTLGEADRAISDVGISAAALLARQSNPAAGSDNAPPPAAATQPAKTGQ